ncbi:MAG: FAD-dependent oxidoreductase [Promethearchaeota archaeon]
MTAGNLKFVTEPERKIPVYRDVDVCVVGGSPSGVAAAVCAARNGAKVLLIDRNPFLGGQSVATMVVQWETRAFTNHLGAVCTRGIAKEFIDAIVAKGGSDGLWNDPPGDPEMRDGEEWLDIEAIKLTLLEFCEVAGVELLLDTLVVDSLVDDRNHPSRVTGVVVENKGGRQAVLARVVVDASADLDVVYRAVGDDGVLVRPPEERVGPGYYVYFGGVDNERFVEYALSTESISHYPADPDKLRHHLATGRLIQFRGFGDIIDAADEKGLLDPLQEIQESGVMGFPFQIYAKWVGHDVWNAEYFSLHPFDATDPAALTKYECARVKLDYALLGILQNTPGWEDAYIARDSVRMGLRETRVLKAVTMVTRDDIFNPDHGRPDCIGRSGGHDPGKKKLWKAYPIPYGCLVPEKLDGVVVAARAVGTADRVALNAHRGIVPTIVVGQAAGTAAALAVRNSVEVRDVDLGELRENLRRADVVLDVETVELDTIPEDFLKKKPAA